MPWWQNLKDEYDEVASWQDRIAAADRAVADVQPEHVDQITEVAKWIPWLPKGVAYSLARSGVTALSVPGGNIALAAVMSKLNAPISPTNPQGELVTKQYSDEQLAHMNWLERAAVTPQGVAKPKGGWGGAVNTLLDAKVPGTLNPRGAMQMASLATPGWVTDNPATRAFADSPVYAGLKGASRAYAAWGDYPRQVMQGSYRVWSDKVRQAGDPLQFVKDQWRQATTNPLQFLADTWADSFSGPNTSMQAEIGQAMAQAAARRNRNVGKQVPDWMVRAGAQPGTQDRPSGPLVDTGSGFFAGGRVKALQHEAEQRYGYITYPDGSKHAHTIGRDIADVFSSPGTKPFTVVSGLADAIVAYASMKPADSARVEGEAAKGLKAIGEGPRAIKAATEGRDMTLTEKLIDGLGGIAHPAKRVTVDPQRVDWALETKPLQKYIDMVASKTSIRELDRLTGGKIDPADLAALASTTDSAQTKEMLRTLLKQGTLTPKTGPWSQYGFELSEKLPEALRRYQSRVPNHSADLNSPRRAFEQMTREMDYLKIPEAHQEQFLRDLATIVADGKTGHVERSLVFKQWDEYAADLLARDVGHDEAGVKRVRDIMRREHERLATETNYYVTPDGQPKNFFGAAVADIQERVPRRDFGDIVDAEIVPEPGAIGPASRAPSASHAPVILPDSSAGFVPKAHTVRTVDEAMAAAPYEGIPDGHIRMFRGEAPGNITRPGQARSRGKWFTPSYAHASKYADGGHVMYVDIPIADAPYLGGGSFSGVNLDEIDPAQIAAIQRGGAPDPAFADFIYGDDHVPRLEMGLDRGEQAASATRGGPLALDDAQLAELMDDTKPLSDNEWRTVGQYIMSDTGRNSPGLLSEHQGRFMPRPDWEEARKQISLLKPLYDHGLDVPVSIAQNFQRIWKPLVVTRPALTVRVLGELQTAMTLRGLSTIFQHPLDYVAWVLADSNHPMMLDRFARGNVDAMGRWFDEQTRFAEVMGQHEWYNPNTVKLNSFPVFKKGIDEQWITAAADQLATLRADPVAQMVVSAMREGRGFDDAANFFWHDMEAERDLLARAHATQGGEMLLNRQGADQYLRDHVWQRVIDHTGGSQDLIDALYTGSLNGERIFHPGTSELNGNFVDQLKGYANDLPDAARGPREIKVGKEGFLDQYNAGMSWALNKIFINRERTLARSPALRQMYYDSVLERAALLDPAYADELAKNLEKAGMKKADIRRATYLAKKPVDGGLSLEAVDHLAWGESVDKLKFYLEDLHARKQWVKAIETVAPFAHVWSESLARWMTLVSESSRPLTLAGRARDVAHDPYAGDLVGVPDDAGAQRGLFYKDQFGQEQIAFPLTGKMMGLFGQAAPVPLHGPVKGLNMAFDFMPAVGPVASVPLAALSDRFDDPKYDTLRNIVFPRGVPSGSTQDRIIGGLKPTWVKYVTEADNSSQQIDAMRYLASTGNYRISGEGATEAEVNRLVNDAKQLSKATSMMRGLATAFTPTAAAPEWFIEGESGSRLPILTLVQDLQQMRNDDPQNATLNFISKYGDNALLLLVGKTIATTPGALPPTDDAEKWLRENKGLQSEYDLVYGLFAPHTGEFSMDAYRRILESGDRAKIDPLTAVRISNDMVAKAIYYRERAKIPDPSSPQAAVLLRTLRDKLAKQYPGYSPYGASVPGIPTKAEPSQVVAQLERVATEKKLADHPAIGDLTKYLSLRKQIVDVSKANGKSDLWFASGDSAGAAVLRKKLWDLGTQLAKDNKDFAPIWEDGLRPEILAAVERDLDRTAGG